MTGTSKKKSTPNGVLFFLEKSRMARFEGLNATVRWTVAADGSTEANYYFLSFGKKMQPNLTGTSATEQYLKCTPITKKHTKRCAFLFGETVPTDLNHQMQHPSGCCSRGLDRVKYQISFKGRKLQPNLAGTCANLEISGVCMNYKNLCFI